MKVLILSCNTGGGHNACAKAVQQSFLSHGDTCDIDDSLRFGSGKVSKFMSWGHTTMYRHIPGLFRFGYGYAENHQKLLQEDKAAYKLLTSGTEELYQLLQEKEYDAVICTHVFSGLLMGEMQRQHPMMLKTAFVATDYTCSPGTAKSDLDIYFIPSALLTEEYETLGVPSFKQIASGIPVRKEFYTCGDKQQAKRQFGVDPEHFHIMMMCGSMGCGPMEELTKALYEAMDGKSELSVVCGTNEKLFERLSKIYAKVPNIHIHGFVKDISALMDSTDLYLTKPGGLSTSEAAAKRLPMVLIDAVAGCEAHNMEFFLRCGGAVTAPDTDSLIQLCAELSKTPEKIEEMRSALTAQFPGKAADVICDKLHKEIKE